jgi:hypothetical protein
VVTTNDTGSLFGVGSPHALRYFLRSNEDGPQPKQVSLVYELDSARGWVEVSTFMSARAVGEDVVVPSLIGSDVPAKPTFPVTSKVLKRKENVSVNGRRRSLTVYQCGSSWVATGRIADRWIQVRSADIDPAELAIVTVDAAQAERVVRGRKRTARRS